MELRENVGRRLMIGIQGPTLDAVTRKHLLELKPGFIILFRRNISSPGQVRSLISQLQDLLPSPPLIAVDQEGGRVIRFTKGVTVFPGNMALGACGSPVLAYQQGLLSALELKQLGITINLAPVLDVITSHHNPGITIRSFGDNPHQVASLGCAFIRGTQKMKVAAVAKHFPGKGAARVDAHQDLPTVAIPKKSFERIHFFPFKQAIGCGVKGLMTSHLHCPTLIKNGHYPTTFSSKIVGETIRQNLNFTGVIFSDDLEMGAIARYYPIEEAAIKATLAGHDVLLICSNYQWQKRAFYALLDEYHRSLLLSQTVDESIKKIEKLRTFCHTPSSYSLSPSLPTPAELAQHIARRAVSILSDKKHLLPFSPQRVENLLVLIPDVSSTSSLLEKGYEPTPSHILLRELRRALRREPVFCFFSLNPTQREIKQLAKVARQCSLCLLCLSNAQYHEGQRTLINTSRGWECDIIFVLLDNPFDYTLLSPQETCITAFGLRKVQLSSLVKVMSGEYPATGEIPFQVKKGG